LSSVATVFENPDFVTDKNCKWQGNPNFISDKNCKYAEKENWKQEEIWKTK